MEKRQYGTNPTTECRHDAHATVDKNLRYRQIKSILKDRKKGLTAKQIAVKLYDKGLAPDSDRNHVSPRLTELCEKGIVEPIGKTLCEYTGRKVTVWRLL